MQASVLDLTEELKALAPLLNGNGRLLATLLADQNARLLSTGNS
jgi:hypothetical protein